MKLNALFLAAVILCGCSTKNGGRRYPIIGIGWVTVNNYKETAAQYDLRLVGAGASFFPVPQWAIGYSESKVIILRTNNIILEIVK